MADLLLPSRGRPYYGTAVDDNKNDGPNNVENDDEADMKD